MSYPDGILLRGSAAEIFLVQGGARRPVPTDVFAASGFRMDKVRVISDIDLAAIPLGATLSLPATDGTVLENARAYAAHHKGSVAQMINGLRVSKQQEHDARIKAKNDEGEQRKQAARGALPTNKAAAESDLQEAKDGQEKLRQRQAEYQSLVASNHLTVLSHTAKIKLEAAKAAIRTGQSQPAHIFYGVPAEVCDEIGNMMRSWSYPVGYIGAFNKHGATYYNIICRREQADNVGGMYPVAEARAKELLAAWVRGPGLMVRIDSFVNQGQVVYGLFHAQSNFFPGWTAYIDVPLQETQGRIAAAVAQGYGIVSQSYIQRPDGAVSGAAVFTKPQAGITSHAQLVTGTEYQRLLDEHTGRRMLPMDLSVATVNGEPCFSVVWAPAEYEAYVARYDLDAQALHIEHLQCLAQGMLPRIVVGYSNGEKVHYAALWVRHPAPPPPPPAPGPPPPSRGLPGSPMRGKFRSGT